MLICVEIVVHSFALYFWVICPINSLSIQISFQFSSLQSRSRVLFFATPQTAARQTSLSNTNSWSLLKLVSIELVMPSNHLILCHPLLLRPSIFPSIRVFSNETALCICSQSARAWASASFLPMNIQGWFPPGLTGLIPLLYRRLSKVFFNTTVQKQHQFFGAQPNFT